MRIDVEFQSEGVTIAAWLYAGEGDGNVQPKKKIGVGWNSMKDIF